MIYQLYKSNRQFEAGRVFLHEQPANAKSWSLVEVKKLSSVFSQVFESDAQGQRLPVVVKSLFAELVAVCESGVLLYKFNPASVQTFKHMDFIKTLLSAEPLP